MLLPKHFSFCFYVQANWWHWPKNVLKISWNRVWFRTLAVLLGFRPVLHYVCFQCTVITWLSVLYVKEVPLSLTVTLAGWVLTPNTVTLLRTMGSSFRPMCFCSIETVFWKHEQRICTSEERRDFYQAAVAVKISNLLVYFLSFVLSCPVLEKDSFIEFFILYCLVSLNSVRFCLFVCFYSFYVYLK